MGPLYVFSEVRIQAWMTQGEKNWTCLWFAPCWNPQRRSQILQWLCPRCLQISRCLSDDKPEPGECISVPRFPSWSPPPLPCFCCVLLLVFSPVRPRRMVGRRWKLRRSSGDNWQEMDWPSPRVSEEVRIWRKGMETWSPARQDSSCPLPCLYPGQAGSCSQIQLSLSWVARAWADQIEATH